MGPRGTTESVLDGTTFREIAAHIQNETGRTANIGLILGSGLADLERIVESPALLPYRDIPHFVSPQVEGHRGRLLMGRIGAASVAMMSGRVHYYEGHSMAQVTLPVRVMQAMGVSTLVITNAAGGLDTTFLPGDLMLITDHINLVSLVGHNPLWGPNEPGLGPRFPDMTAAYDPGLREIALEVAQQEGIPLRQGVYAMVSGPSFETPAEIRYLRLAGADAVGMSTAHEVIVARHAGMRVMGVSGISNVAAGLAGTEVVSHQEVLEAGAVIAPRLSALIKGVLSRISGS